MRNALLMCSMDAACLLFPSDFIAWREQIINAIIMKRPFLSISSLFDSNIPSLSSYTPFVMWTSIQYKRYSLQERIKAQYFMNSQVAWRGGGEASTVRSSDQGHQRPEWGHFTQKGRYSSWVGNIMNDYMQHSVNRAWVNSHLIRPTWNGRTIPSIVCSITAVKRKWNILAKNFNNAKHLRQGALINASLHGTKDLPA